MVRLDRRHWPVEDARPAGARSRAATRRRTRPAAALLAPTTGTSSPAPHVLGTTVRPSRLAPGSTDWTDDARATADLVRSSRARQAGRVPTMPVPGGLAASPAHPDPLVDIAMTGVLHSTSRLTEPWGVAVPSLPQVVAFHVTTSGRGVVEVDGRGTEIVGARRRRSRAGAGTAGVPRRPVGRPAARLAARPAARPARRAPSTSLHGPFGADGVAPGASRGGAPDPLADLPGSGASR